MSSTCIPQEISLASWVCCASECGHTTVNLTGSKNSEEFLTIFF